MLATLMNLYQRHAARRMFSRWSPIYEQEVEENSYSAAERCIEAVTDLTKKNGFKHPVIADIGIGTGLVAEELKQAFPCRITGLDFSEDMMAVCASKEVADSLIKCDVGRDFWPLADHSHDIVVSAGLCEYLSPQMLHHFLVESRRTLQQNGYLIFTYMPRSGTEKPIRFWNGHSGTYLIFGYTPEEISALASFSGFAVLTNSEPFKGCVFGDGSSYDYRLLIAKFG